MQRMFITNMNYHLNSFYNQLQCLRILDCATLCLKDGENECLAYEFHEMNKACKLSNQTAQIKESAENSFAKVYTGIANIMLL